MIAGIEHFTGRDGLEIKTNAHTDYVANSNASKNACMVFFDPLLRSSFKFQAASLEGLTRSYCGVGVALRIIRRSHELPNASLSAAGLQEKPRITFGNGSKTGAAFSERSNHKLVISFCVNDAVFALVKTNRWRKAFATTFSYFRALQSPIYILEFPAMKLPSHRVNMRPRKKSPTRTTCSASSRSRRASFHFRDHMVNGNARGRFASLADTIGGDLHIHDGRCHGHG